MRILLLLVFATFSSLSAIAQSDTIYTNNDKIACTITEVAPDVIKFTYPNETITNSMYKNAVQKIIFKSGRIQVFSEATSFKNISGPLDYGNVTITRVESEVKGLYKVGDVSSKAKGTTALSNQERVKERAYQKLKMQASMQGANIVYLTDQRTEGNQLGTEYQASHSAETNLTGVAYSSKLPSYEDFMKKINNRKRFVTAKEIKLWGSASDLSIKDVVSELNVSDIVNDNGVTYVIGEIKGVKKISKFRMVHFDEGRFHLFYKKKSTVYTVTVGF